MFEADFILRLWLGNYPDHTVSFLRITLANVILDTMINPSFAKMHREGWIHIHDLDFYGWTTTCTQIELRKLFKGGFSTGHGHLREPKSIGSYAALAAIAIQSNQNDQHGGQSVPNFDYGMAPGVKKTYLKLYRQNLARAIELLADVEDIDELDDFEYEEEENEE